MRPVAVACPESTRIGWSGTVVRHAACRPEWGQHIASCALAGTDSDSAKMLADWRAERMRAARR